MMIGGERIRIHLASSGFYFEIESLIYLFPTMPDTGRQQPNFIAHESIYKVDSFNKYNRVKKWTKQTVG
jgi:hypothetical protein